MRIFGLTITRGSTPANMQPLDSRGGWWPIIRESFTGAWQKNVEIKHDCVLAYSAVFACITLIAADIGKMRFKLTEKKSDETWKETTSAAFSPVLRKPNPYQTHIQFKEQWITSKLSRGNAYALKVRDARGIVTALYLLDPLRVRPLVAPDGSVYYQLNADHLSGLIEDISTVPASEIIHDRMNCLFHPLVGVSPIFACGLSAVQGLEIQKNSTSFFKNGSKPGGVLTAPGAISDETAKRLKDSWDANYSGENAGKVAVLGDGLKYESMAVTAVDAQLIEQLKFSAETVCSTFHVPAYKIGVGAMPTNNNIEALDQQYYSQCLQTLIESMELCLDEGLALPMNYGTELDLDGLLRMDTATLTKTLGDAVGAGLLAPNEARLRLNFRPVEGGSSPYLQQQNFSLEALAKRDALANPFVIDKPVVAPTPAGSEPAADNAKQVEWQRKSFESLALELAA